MYMGESYPTAEVDKSQNLDTPQQMRTYSTVVCINIIAISIYVCIWMAISAAPFVCFEQNKPKGLQRRVS